jgi:putative ABC transport system permease protein
MLKNYFKIAIRSLLKQKTFSFINIFGLALGMSVCLLIITLIKDAHNYDLFHTQSDQVYRVITSPIRKAGETERYATSPFPVGKTIAEENTQVELWTPIVNRFSGTISFQKKEINYQGLLTDNSFFDMFGFRLSRGDVSSALSNPYTIILTQELSQKLFNQENPLGQEIEVLGFANPFKVMGVLEEFPGKTHLEFEALGSLTTQFAEEKLPESRKVSDNWQNYYSSYNFLRLKDPNDKAATEKALDNISATKYSDLQKEVRDLGYNFSLQSLGEITPGPILSNSMGRGMPDFMIWFLSVLGVIIILSACFNYTNLTIARSFVRTKEVGVRKVVGASRSQIFRQFMVESIITAFVAFILGYAMMQGLKPLFLKLQFSEFTDLNLSEDGILIAQFVLFTIGVGCIAGLLPGITLSRISPQAILQNLQNIKLIRRFGIRKILMVVQLIVTLIFFITVTIVWRQVDYASKITFGFNQPKTLIIDLQGEDYTRVSNAFTRIQGVEKLSAISNTMGTWQDGASDVRIKKDDEEITVREYYIDENYLNSFDLELVAGENFDRNLSQRKELFTIVNETFVKHFNLNDDSVPVGQTILVGDTTQLNIRGVVKDFLFKPANYSMEPLMLRYDPSQFRRLNLSLSSNDIPATVAALEKSWKKFSNQPFDAQFYEESIAETYSNMTDILWIVTFFGIMSMVISCMGLLGMAIYLVRSKAKEISIRKTLGASVNDLILLLSKNYLILFGIAVLIATPVSYLLGTTLLEVFANRISISSLLFLPGILLLFSVIVITISSQTIRAALSNPSKSLRSE